MNFCILFGYVYFIDFREKKVHNVSVINARENLADIHVRALQDKGGHLPAHNLMRRMFRCVAIALQLNSPIRTQQKNIKIHRRTNNVRKIRYA